MLDSNIIEEALRESNEQELNENGRKKKSAKEQLFESLLHEMYPQADQFTPEKNKYTRMSDLIRILQDALWKIQDYERNIDQNPEDKDIYDTAKQNYENMINSTIDRIKEVWNSAEQQDQSSDSQSGDVDNPQDQTSDQSSGDVDWSQVTLQLQPEEIIISPQNKEYYVMEVNEDKTRLKEVTNGEIWFVDTSSVKKWKKK